MSDRYVIVIEGDERTNFGAYAPDVPGCVATGSTVEQTVKRMREALWLHLGAMRAANEPIPPATTVVGDPLEYPDSAIGMIEVTPRPIRHTAAAA